MTIQDLLEQRKLVEDFDGALTLSINVFAAKSAILIGIDGADFITFARAVFDWVYGNDIDFWLQFSTDRITQDEKDLIDALARDDWFDFDAALSRVFPIFVDNPIDIGMSAAHYAGIRYNRALALSFHHDFC